MAKGATIMVFLSLMGMLYHGTDAAGGGSWNYVRDDSSQGPSNWDSITSSKCDGTKNSPINIDTSKVVTKDGSASEWTITGWDQSSTWTITNKQYTVQYDLTSGSITTAGGNLPATYDLVQFHFHWGSTNSAGSEHKVDDKYYPLEVHLVHKKNTYAGLSEALASQESDALAAVGFFFTIQTEDNPALTKLIEGVSSVQNTNTASGFDLGELDSIFKEGLDGEEYFRYEGGLTTPTCNEVVAWTVFRTPIGISNTQMAAFRALRNGDYGTELYRPVQALGDRTVTLYNAGIAIQVNLLVVISICFVNLL